MRDSVNAARRPDLVLGVEVDRGSLEHPILIADGTGGVPHLREIDLAVRMDRHRLCHAAAVAVEDLEIGPVESGARHVIVGAGVAVDAELRIFEVHGSLDHQFSALFIVGDRIRRDAAFVLMNLHVAGEDREAGGIERRRVAVDANQMIAGSDDHRRSLLALRRRGAHIARADHRGRQKA